MAPTAALQAIHTAALLARQETSADNTSTNVSFSLLPCREADLFVAPSTESYSSRDPLRDRRTFVCFIWTVLTALRHMLCS